MKAKKKQLSNAQGLLCALGCGSALLYSITFQNGRSKFCTSEHLFVLAGEAEPGAGGAEELRGAGLLSWPCACSELGSLRLLQLALPVPALLHSGLLLPVPPGRGEEGRQQSSASAPIRDCSSSPGA